MASPLLAGERRMAGVERNEVGGAPAAMPARPGAECRGCRLPAPRRTAARPVEPLARPSTLRSRCARRCEYSSWRSSSATPISTLEVGADAEAAAGLEEAAGGEDAVAEIGLGDRAQAGDRAAPGQRAGLGLGHVGGVDQAPAPVDLRVGQAAIRPAARPTRRRSPRPPSVCSATWMWIGPSPASSVTAVKFLRRHGAQAVRGDADDRARRAAAAARRLASSRRAKPSRSLTKRRWPSFGAAPPKPECA